MRHLPHYDELTEPEARLKLFKVAPPDPSGPDSDALPDADLLAHIQLDEAVERLHEDASHYPHYPWPSLATVAGPLCPEDLVIVTARTGNGKSLFLQNLFDHLIVHGLPGLYVGLEQKADILRNKWACLRADVPPRLVLAPQRGERGTTLWQQAMEAVQRELQWQRTPGVRACAHFSATRKINAAGLKRWTEWAVDHDCGFVIVDHVDRIQQEGKNPFHEVSETVRLAKELAAKHRIVMILASQVGRPSDTLEQFMPPALHNMRGAGTKEEEADVVLGIYRPLRASVTADEMKQARQGLVSRDTIVEPNVMGVMLLKHRLDGPAMGKTIKLDVFHQRVLEPQQPLTYSGYPMPKL